MATFPDSYTDIQVESCTVTKSAYLLTENITLNFKLKNIASSTIQAMKFYIIVPFSDLDPDYSGFNYHMVEVKTQGSLAWGKNTSRQFSFTINASKYIKLYDSSRSTTVYPQMVNKITETRSMPIRVSMWVNRSGTSDDHNAYDYPAFNYTLPNACFINKRYLKSIKFNLDRYPTDESTTLATTMKVTFTSDAGNYKDDFTVKLYCAQGDNVSESSPEVTMAIDYNILYGSGYTNNTTVITGDYIISKNYSFLLVVSDGKEVMTAKTIVSRAFANVHFSGQPTGGVALGRFSTSELNNPKFECEYPAYFYGGINDIGTTIESIPVESDVTTPDSGSNGNGVLRICKLFGIVFISGGIFAKPASTSRRIGTIPSKYRPSGSVYRIVACDGFRYARINIGPDGSMNLDWVVVIGTNSKYTSYGLWIDCNMFYTLE